MIHWVVSHCSARFFGGFVAVQRSACLVVKALLEWFWILKREPRSALFNAAGGVCLLVYFPSHLYYLA